MEFEVFVWSKADGSRKEYEMFISKKAAEQTAINWVRKHDPVNHVYSGMDLGTGERYYLHRTIYGRYEYRIVLTNQD